MLQNFYTWTWNSLSKPFWQLLLLSSINFSSLMLIKFVLKISKQREYSERVAVLCDSRNSRVWYLPALQWTWRPIGSQFTTAAASWRSSSLTYPNHCWLNHILNCFSKYLNCIREWCHPTGHIRRNCLPFNCFYCWFQHQIDNYFKNCWICSKKLSTIPTKIWWLLRVWPQSSRRTCSVREASLQFNCNSAWTLLQTLWSIW